MPIKDLLQDSDVVTEAELRSAGAPADAYRAGVPIQQLVAAGPSIFLPPSSTDELLSAPLSVDDLILLAGTAASDGRYRVVAIPGPHEITVVGLFGAAIVNQGAPSPAPPTAGALAMIHEEGAHRTGTDPTGLVVATADNVEDAIVQIDTALAAGFGAPATPSDVTTGVADAGTPGNPRAFDDHVHHIDLAVPDPGGNDGAMSALQAAELAALVGASVIAGAGLTGGGSLGSSPTLDTVANADGSIVVNPDDIQVGVLATDDQHGALGIAAAGGPHHGNATGTDPGFMPAADRLLTGELLTFVAKVFADSPATLAASQGYCMVDTTGGIVVVNLPAAPAQVGELHTVADSIGNAGVNKITVQGNGANIDGGAFFDITVAYGSITVVWTGTIWKII